MDYEIDLNETRVIGTLVQFGEVLQKFAGCALMLAIGVPSLRKIGIIQEHAYLHLGDETMQSCATLSRQLKSIRTFATEMWPYCPPDLFEAKKCGRQITFGDDEKRICQAILATLEKVQLIEKEELTKRSQIYKGIWESIKS
jgi:hypothetical protein